MKSTSVRLRKVTCFVFNCSALGHITRYRPIRQRQLFRYFPTSFSAREKSYPSYEYTDLPGPRWIRLLEIPALNGSDRTADTSTPVSCRLVNISLDNKPSYDALSYAWDNQVPDRILHLQDETDNTTRQLLITENCEDAIRAFQRALLENTSLRIWIDAISINQANTKEKNSQVSMMADIYKRAFCVRVWLGRATPDSYGALRVLLALSMDKKVSPDTLSNAALRKSIDSLGSRSYWQRIWTLQEIAVAKGVLAYVGDERFHYFIMANAFQRTGDDLDFFRMGAHFLMHLKAKNSLEDDGVVHRLTTLMLAQTKYSSDPRDKIYAMRSIMPDMFKDIVVDYGKSVQEVFAEGTRAVIENTDSLEVLFFRSATELSATMPSWVVDWSNADHLIQLMHQAHVPKKSTTASVRITFSNNFQILNLYGRVIDTVEHVDWPLSRKFDYQLERARMGMPKYLSSLEGTMDIVTIRHWIDVAIGTLQGQFPIHQIIAQIAKVLDPNSAHNDELYAWLRFTATNIPFVGCSIETLDAAWQGKLPAGFDDKARSILFPAYKGPLVELPVETKILMNVVFDMKGDKKLIRQHFDIIRRLGGKKLFITSEGCMGTSDAHLEKGDRIMVFEGSSFPMIVRSDGMKNVLIGSANVPSLEIDALLEDEGLLDAIQIS